MSEKEFKARLRIRRENRDRGWKAILADPAMREALWELYTECMTTRDAVTRQDGDASIPMTFRAMGKRAIGDWLENRCELADQHKWLLLLAEHKRPIDDGRADEQREAEEEPGE